MKKDCRNELYIMLASIIILYYFDVYNSQKIRIRLLSSTSHIFEKYGH